MFRQQLMDIFGKTAAAVDISEKRIDREKARDDLDASFTPLTALNALIECSEGISAVNDFNEILKEVNTVEKETSRFFSTGQRTEVDLALARTQCAEVETSLGDFQIRRRSGQARIHKLLSVTTEPLECPDMNVLISEVKRYQKADSSLDPTIRLAQTELEVAQAQVRSERTRYLPRLTLIGSLGYIQETELNVPKKNWSLAVGLIFPLLDLVSISKDVDAAKYESLAREKELDAARYESEEWRRMADERSNELALRINNLSAEEELARKAYGIARKRYERYQGNLVELREAVRAWATAKTNRVRTSGEYLKVVSANLLNHRFFAPENSDADAQKEN